MSKKRICFIAQFPPPIHGLSKAVDTLYNSYLNDIFEFEKIDLTKNKLFFKNLIQILSSNAELFYFTISQSKGGNIRDLIILNILKIRKKKCLIHLHGGYYRKLIEEDMGDWQKKINYRTISKVDGVIVLSQSLRSIFSGMIDEGKIYVVPNCVDDEFLMTDDDFERKLARVDSKPIKQVLYLSNFIKSKGYPLVLQMALMEKKFHLINGKRRLHFNFAGNFFEEKEAEFFNTYIMENNLQQYITYHGVIKGDKKRHLLEECDIFMLPTRYPNEGQPISILEAMANGMFIIVTDHAGIPDIVKDEENGIILKVENKDNFSSLYDRIKCDKQVMMNNRAKIINYYIEEIYLDNMKKLFRTI